MNAAQRRINRRAITSALGLTPGQSLMLGDKPATLVQVSPGGRHNALVKRSNGRTYAYPLGDVMAGI